MKYLQLSAIILVLTLGGMSNAWAPPPPPSCSDEHFSPTVMFGLTYSFGGGGNATENLGLTAKLLSTNEANHFVLGGGVSYFPGAKDQDKLGLDGGVGFNGTNVTGLVGYDILRQAPQISVGATMTSEKDVTNCVY